MRRLLLALLASVALPCSATGVTPSSIDFGSVLVNHGSAMHTITVINTSSVPVLFDYMGFPTGFDTYSPTCNEIPVGGSCSYEVQFAPRTPGPYSGTAVFSYGGLAVGVLLQGTSVPVPYDPNRIDRNADGLEDLVWSNADGGFWVRTMHGASEYYSSPMYGSGGAYPLLKLLATDFDGDGRTDFAWLWSDGSLLVNYSNSGGHIWNDPLATGMLSGDFDGDRYPELVIGKSDGSTEIWSSLQPGQTLSKTVLLSAVAANGWYVEHVADFDGDGISDLLWTNADGGIGIWLMNGIGTTKDRQVVFQSGSGWRPVKYGDFNGDGQTDIIFEHTSGAIGMWLMNGTAAISKQMIFPAATGWSVTHVADLNGDGKADLVWGSTAGDTGIWLMDGMRVLDRQVVMQGTSGWRVATTADVDGDGKQDLFWVHTDGSVYGWLMDGMAVRAMWPLQNVYLPLGTGLWWPIDLK